MKTQHEATIQFSGYPLNIEESEEKNKKAELTVVKSSASIHPLQKISPANDPKNWDVDWFNCYE